MTIVYCSWATGDDTTGTGAWDKPYKTITKATTGRTGGDEVRVAKSPDPTPLTGTVGFTQGSTAVTGSGTLFTTELAIGDFIQAPDGQYYEVVTITSDTAAVLFKVYPSATQSGYSSKKLGVTDTGAAASTSTQVQVVSSSGTSSANLVISGGWDLSTQTQTGQTFFRQLNTTSFANRYGYGLYLSGKTFTEISRLHFLRYYYGIYYNGSNSNTLTSPTCNSNGSYGIYYYSYSNNNTCYGTLTTNGNTSGAIFNNNSINKIAKANLSETTKFTGAADYANSRVFVDNLNNTGNAYIYTDNGNIQSRDATAGGTGKEWVLSPTNSIRGAKYPLDLSVAKVAVAGSGQVTVKLYFKKTGTGVAGALRVRYGQINWSDDAEDKIVNCPDNTNRNQVTLTFTPTEAGVVEIEALAWYVSSTTQSVIVDDIEITQA